MLVYSDFLDFVQGRIYVLALYHYFW